MDLIWLLATFALITFFPRVHSTTDDDSINFSQLNDCLAKIKEIPANVSAPFEIKREKNHIELVVKYGGIIDYYEMDWRGTVCNSALGLSEIPTRTAEEQEDCDNRTLSTNWDDGQFKCGFDVWTPEDEFDDYVVLYIKQIIHGALGSNAYIINKSTNKIVFDIFPHQDSGVSIFNRYKEIDPTIVMDECLRRVSHLPEYPSINLDLQVYDKNAVITFSYQGKFDYYELNWNASVLFFKTRLDEIPERPAGESPSEDNGSEFKCPFKIEDDEEYSIVVIAIPHSSQYEAYVYFINKLNFEVNFMYYPIFYDHILEVPSSTGNLNTGFNAKIDSCLNHKNLLPESLATSLNVSRISDHIQITVNYDGKFDYYGINYNGHTCYTFRGFTGPLNLTMEEAVKECDKRRITQCLTCNDYFKCGWEVLRPKNDHYLALAIRTSPYSHANVYLFDELTNEVHFNNYSTYHAGFSAMFASLFVERILLQTD